MKRLRPVLVLATIVAAGLLAVVPATAAFADDPTTTTFSADSSQTVSYGTNWIMKITVAGSNPYDYVTPTSGTVNVLIKGVPGTYATGLPLAPGGVAFFSPPGDQPALGAGTYLVTALYIPSGTAYLAASQTLTPATLTVTPLDLSSTFTVNKTTIDNKPAVQVVATATRPNANSAIPSGSWLVTAKDSTGAVAYRSTTPLAKNPADPVTITLGQKVTAGHEYTVTAAFVPKASVAGGYTVKNGAPQTVIVEPPPFGEVITTPLAVPVWALVLIAIGLAALVAAAVVLLVQATRRSRAGTTGSDSQPV